MSLRAAAYTEQRGPCSPPDATRCRSQRTPQCSAATCASAWRTASPSDPASSRRPTPPRCGRSGGSSVPRPHRGLARGGARAARPEGGRACHRLRSRCSGAGLIGQSWTALFLAAGRSVAVFDPDPAAEARVRTAVSGFWLVLTALGLTDGAPGTLVVHDTARAAVEGAQFVQESAPERIDVKHALYAEIEAALNGDAMVALVRLRPDPERAAGRMVRPGPARARAPVQPAAPHPACRGDGQRAHRRRAVPRARTSTSRSGR